MIPVSSSDPTILDGRKSLALYYYTNGRPVEEVSAAHGTEWKARRGEDLGLPLRSRLKALALDLLLPVITRQIRHSRQWIGEGRNAKNGGTACTEN